MAKKVNDECKSYNRIQVNLSIDKDSNGGVLRKSLLINIREDSVEEASKLYRDLLSKIGESAESANNIASQVETQLNSTPQNPLCPICNAKMVRRINGKKGNQFWGCSTFPRCKGVRQIEQVFSGEQLIPIE